MSYQCHGQPRPAAGTTYPAQDGWEYQPCGAAGIIRVAKVIRVQNTASRECIYTITTKDSQCNGCQHQQVL